MGFPKEAKESLLRLQHALGREPSDAEIAQHMRTLPSFDAWLANQGRRFLLDRFGKAVNDDARRRQQDLFGKLPAHLQTMPPVISLSNDEWTDLRDATKTQVQKEVARLEEERIGLAKTIKQYKDFIAWRDRTGSWPP